MIRKQTSRSTFVWAWVAAVVGFLVYFNVSVGIQRRSLNSALAEVREKIKGIKVELVEGEYARESAKFVFSGWYSETKAMTKMLRKCRSREDFVVREGPRIAWSELSNSTGRARMIGIYLPPGKHWLKYSFAGDRKLATTEYLQYERGNPRELPDVVSVELGPEPEVYELHLRVGDDEVLRISLIGRDNASVHEEALPQKISQEQLMEQFSEDKFAYPGEFKPRDEERPYVLEAVLPPVTDLGFLRVPVRSKNQVASRFAVLRLWIESDARPCMPAIYVAANYDKVTSLRFRHDRSPWSERSTESDMEFNRLFEPYDDAHVFRFREGIFEPD